MHAQHQHSLEQDSATLATAEIARLHGDQPGRICFYSQRSYFLLCFLCRLIGYYGEKGSATIAEAGGETGYYDANGEFVYYDNSQNDASGGYDTSQYEEYENAGY